MAGASGIDPIPVAVQSVATDVSREASPVSVRPEAEEAGSWPDDAAESAFLAEARERGETAAPSKPKEESVEETDAKPLPALNELVQRIPADVRETLEDLFRARFVTVKRVPKRALKS